MATLDRRSLLAAAQLGLLSACQAKTPLARSTKSRIDVTALNVEATAIAADARPGVLGV
eukprot:gene34962-57832_t